MTGRKCPNYSCFRFHPKKLKYKCKNCDYGIQVPLSKIWSEESKDTIIDRINSKST